MYTLVGSRALRQHFPDFPRNPADWDYYTDASGLTADVFYDERLEAWPFGAIATPDELYTMKVSHSFWEIGNTWDKHMHDIVWMKNAGCAFNRDLYDILKPIWKDQHGRKRTNLKQSKDAFFSDAVHRIYDHDSIHDSVAYGDRPMYEQILLPGEEVAVSIEPFHAMSFEDKCKLVREEVYATALERYVIPSNYTCSPRGAYAKAMKKTVTSLFKNDWALWIVLNYSDVRDPDMDYVAHHRSNASRLILL